ncbi:MAG: 2-amino-4-hydroxy-6-hydroxymethyldihydropteridine diphosphokinase [Bdellovibrionales bacterium]|nr:2-amino-4-hydroxy-6-hydroxymethyldihydropteridine diphosphokinase [Bdellovibrionales bacterium]
MTSEVHEALVGIKVFSNEGQELLSEVAKDLRQKMDFVGASSIYRVWGNINHPEHIHDLRRIESFEGLAAVIKVRSTQSPRDLLKFLQDVETKYRSEVLRRSISLNLLVYEDLSYMTPEMTIPHPELHRRPESLLLAAEVWGDYIHPVLNENLYTLTRRFHDEQWGRFYAQGKTLLDF